MNDFNSTLPEQNQQLQMRFAESGPVFIAGLCEPLSLTSHQTIPLLWQQLAVRANEIPNRVDAVGYGLCVHGGSSEFYYLAGYAVWDIADLPPGINSITLAAQAYGVFTHPGHVAQIRTTIDEVFDHWLPGSGQELDLKPGNKLHFFERYGEGFNPETGIGDIEIWIPLKEHD
jgi:AraC family transcriptional regulator